MFLVIGFHNDDDRRNDVCGSATGFWFGDSMTRAGWFVNLYMVQVSMLEMARLSPSLFP